MRFWVSLLVFSCVLSCGEHAVVRNLDLERLSKPVRTAIVAAQRAASSVDLGEEPDQRAAEWGELGMLLQAQNLYQSAVDAYTVALETNTSAKWFYLRALSSIELGNLEYALQDLQQVVKIQPEVSVVWYRLGDAHLRSGYLDDAHDALTRALSLSQNDPAVLVSYGYLMNERGQSEQALEYLLRAAESQPDAGQVAYRIASTYRRLGNRQKQAHWLNKRNELAPSSF